MTRIDLPAPEATITSRDDEPLALTEEIASGAYGGLRFRVLRDLARPFELRVRTHDHTVRIDIQPAVHAAVHAAFAAREEA